MADLHNRLLKSDKFPIYNAEYYKVLPFIVELRNRGDKDVNEIETCLDALYGIMMLRMQKKEITPETEHAIKEISTFIGLLSDYYIKEESEGLDFGENE
jgi:flagellin-specific chaperone FliS